MTAESLEDRAQALPDIIQGGMGVAVSGWKLAGEVATAGAAGTVSVQR
jgi:NAD(P)H-dependent flavin oxidoreductase YrpB (nitropropane dioxygenase family)